MDPRPSAGSRDVDRVMRILSARASSEFLVHDDLCCRAARSWLDCQAKAANRLHGLDPSWISRRWPWGPMCWPTYWCEVLRLPELDCGALAVLAEAAFAAAGRETCRIQLLEQADRAQTAHWHARWRAAKCSTQWLWDDLIYHEAVGVLKEQSLRMWDPARAIWRMPAGWPAEGRTLAIRVTSRRAPGAGHYGPTFRWAENEIRPGVWTQVSSEYPNAAEF